MAPSRTSGSGDPGWEHGVAQDVRKKKVRCNYCGKIVSGGIYRLKQHLARISGEVTHCVKAPEEVFLKMKENLGGHQSSKRQRQAPGKEKASLDFLSNDDEVEEATGYKEKEMLASSDRSLVVTMPPPQSLGFADPGWEHGIPQDERKKKVKCNYCEKVVSGGINRFKQHLARIRGEVAYCQMAPEEVYLKMKENMKWHLTGKRQHPESKEPAPFYMKSDNENVSQIANLVNQKTRAEQVDFNNKLPPNILHTKRLKMLSPDRDTNAIDFHLEPSKLNSPVTGEHTSHSPIAHKQMTKAVNDEKGCDEVMSAICRFFFHAGVPFVAADTPYFQKMLDLVSQYGQGLKIPSSRLISDRLQDEVDNLKESLVELKMSWMVTGCSIMAESWKDLQGRALINFLVSCPHGVYFISSVDASETVQDAKDLFALLDKIVDEIGEENVVQVVTESTADYRTAGKMLEEKRQNLFWTPCAALCIVRMLEDFLKIKCVRECLVKSQKITRFIYNQTWLINLMKKEFTAGQELLQPAVTRCASSFVTMKNLLDHRSALRKMFQSDEWSSSRFSRMDEGKEVEKIVLDSTFWKRMQYLNLSVDPILQVLLKLDSEKGLSMASIYNDMYRARIAIKEIHSNDERKYGPFWSVIDSHWNSLFHHPLYLSAYFLNPTYRYHPDFLAPPEISRGLNECIVRLEPDGGRRISASMQISDFVSAKADFGTELAISTRTLLDPAAWWQQHGINCIELQRIAIRILSQTCSSICGEQKWSTFDQIRSMSGNHIVQQNLNNLIYVRCNLRLKERQFRTNTNESLCVDSTILENLLGDWISETQKPALQEVEEILYNDTEPVETYGNEMNEMEELDTKATKKASDASSSSPEIVERSEVQKKSSCKPII